MQLTFTNWRIIIKYDSRLIDTKTLATQTSLAERLETSTLEPMVKCLQDAAFGLVDAG